jgi:hypothetical protein
MSSNSFTFCRLGTVDPGTPDDNSNWSGSCWLYLIALRALRSQCLLNEGVAPSHDRITQWSPTYQTVRRFVAIQQRR